MGFWVSKYREELRLYSIEDLGTEPYNYRSFKEDIPAASYKHYYRNLLVGLTRHHELYLSFFLYKYLYTSKSKFTWRRLRPSSYLTSANYLQDYVVSSNTYTTVYNLNHANIVGAYYYDAFDGVIPINLCFNFTRNKFFPTITDFSGVCYLHASIGMMGRRFNKGKSTYRTKAMFMATASLLRKVFLYVGLDDYTLIVKKIPTYLLEILTTILRPVVNIYKHPFGNIYIDERKIKNPFSVSRIFFYNNKPYSFMKGKKQRTLKRKISRKVFLKNRILDTKN